MSTNSYDVIIIGGGIAGLAIAYHVGRHNASVLLLEADTLGSGTSGACAGRAQISEGPRGKHMDVVLEGLAKLEGLEEELGYEFEWRRLGNLILIEHDHHWQSWSDQITYLKDRGVPADILDPADLIAIEPLLKIDRFRGAAWCLEGHLNPFKFMRAYANAARQQGADLRQHTPVTGFTLKGGRIVAVQTPQGSFSAQTVVVTAGAWTRKLLASAGLHLPIQFTHAEAVISEPLPPILNNHIGLADFYETIHNAARAVSIGLAQQQSGALLITEAVAQLPDIHRANSHWGISDIARDLLALFPKLADVRLIRAWAAPSPFLLDEQPAIGWLAGADNCFVATCFHLTITTIPVLSERMAALILQERADPYLSAFSPARFQREVAAD
ncbi:MAG: FAD-binding oxidoreductase [Chloroflexi bacterium]|nr:FAD-binding oxidoreductase [Chloroflexota bacterium]